LAVKTTRDRAKDFSDVDLVLKLVYFSTKQLDQYLDICNQFFVPVKQRLERATLDTFDASRDEVLVVVSEEGGRLSGG